MSEATLTRADSVSRLAAVAARMLADVDRLVALLAVAYRRDIPEYASMSEARVRREVLPISRRAITTFFDSLVSGEQPGTADLAVFEESGRARLRMGVPLDSVLHAYRVAGGIVWTAVVAAIQPGEETLLADLAARWMHFIDLVSSSVARGYVSESDQRVRDAGTSRDDVVQALLGAAGPADVAAVGVRFGVELAPAYAPALVSAAGRLLEELRAAAPSGTLAGSLGQRTLLLAPYRLDDPDRLRRAAGRSLVAWGRPAAPGPALVAEVRHVEMLLDTAAAAGHDAGGFGPDDLIVEQLLRDNERVSDALRRRVADRLADRDAGGLLASTLRAYLDCGSVPETARRACVHPNTVAYRLGRVRDITGLDARVPVEATLLVLGLAVPAARRPPA